MKDKSTDSLTGLPQRRRLEEMRPAFSRRDPDSPWTLIMADVDHFKLINDIYGHLTGDQVLRRVAQLLRENLRREDAVMRFGGDEFLIVFPSTGRYKALNYAQRIIEELEAMVFQRGLRVTVSLGIAESSKTDEGLDEVLERADRALYQARESGRGRIHFFERSLEEAEDSESLSFSHFVGRQQELKKLRQLLDEGVSEGCRIALITGEAGAGKSRLAMELRHYAEFR